MAEKPARTRRHSKATLPTRVIRGRKLRAPSRAAVMEAAFELSRQLSVELREADLVSTVARTLGELLPERYVGLRVIDPRTLEVTAAHVAGASTPDRRRRLLAELRNAPLSLKRTALKRTRLAEELARSERLVLADEYMRVFSGSSGGFSVPLVASGELFGLLNIEYPPPADLGGVDQPLVIPLANQLSVALRNLHLLGEARYYRDYLCTVIDVANALIMVIDREGRVAVVNRAMQRYAGIGPEVLGQPFGEVRRLAPTDEPRLATLMLDGLDGVEYTDREVPLWRPSVGAFGRAVFNTSIVRAPDGSIDGVIAVGQETERLRALERQVIQAEKLATLGQLAAGVVHELNNPLTSISVYGSYLVKLLERIGDRGDVDKALKINNGVERIQKLTRDLMSYARPSGEWEKAAVNDVVRQALVFCEHVIIEAGATMRLELSDDLPRLSCIRAQLHQVLINLITNACHALPLGGTVTLATWAEPDDKAVCVAVADTGAGIHQLDREHVFEPFFTTKKDGRGTGLGLSIVKNIVEGHGGTVRFESRMGSGTTFFITLPTEDESRAR